MKKIIISGYHGFNNAGDEVILVSILKMLRRQAERAGMPLDLTVLSASPARTRRDYGVNAVGRTNLFSIVRTIWGGDLLISGGGSLLQDKTGYGLSVLYYLGLVLLARFLGVPTVLYAHGVGPIQRPFNRRIAGWIINRVDLVTLRDDESRQELDSLGVNRPPVRVTVDPAFYLNPNRQDGGEKVQRLLGELQGQGPLVGFCVREWLGQRQFLEEIAKTADQLVDQLDARILFIPMFPRKDLPVSRLTASLMNRRDRARVMAEELAPEELLSVFSHLDLQVGVRLHSLIFAAMAGVPMVGIYYDPKISAFLGQLGLPFADRVETLQAETLYAHCLETWQQREELTRRLQAVVGDFRQEAEACGQEVFAHFFGAPGETPEPEIKVLHLISGGDTGGAKNHVLSLAQELAKKVPVSLVCFMEGDFSREGRQAGLDIRVIPQKRRYDLGVVRDLRRMISQEGCTVLHCHGARANFVAAVLRRRLDIPALTTMHSDYKLDFQGSFYKNLVYTTLNAWALRKFGYFVAVSDSFKEMLVQRGFPRARIFVTYNGIDFQVSGQQTDRESFLQRYGLEIPPAAKIVGIMGRLHPVKDHELFLRGAREVLQAQPETHFLIAGDGEEKKRLLALRDSLGLQDHVHFLGYVDNPDAFIQLLDINTLTSRSESFPLVLLEGARQRKPTVSSDVGGVDRLIFDGETGLLFPAGDPRAFAAQTVRLLRDEEAARVMGENLYHHARENYSLERLGQDHLQIYRKVLISHGVVEKEETDENNR